MSHTSSNPSIRVYDSAAHHGRYRPSCTSSPAIPMPIPNAKVAPPPPLPPPRHITELRDGHDLGWHWGNTPNGAEVARTSWRSVKPGSSLLGGDFSGPGKPYLSSEPVDLRPGARSGTVFSHRSADSDMDNTETSDEDARLPRRPSMADHRLQSENQLGQRSLATSSNAYDKQLLSKIGGPNTPTTRCANLPFFSTAQEKATFAKTQPALPSGRLQPLTVPDRVHAALDSPSPHWNSVPSSGALSPGYSGFRSPVFESGPPPGRIGRCGTARGTSEDADTVMSRSHRGSEDHTVFMDSDFMEESGMRDLHIHERSPSGSEEYQSASRAGVKRRAPTPPVEASRDDRPAGTDSNDLYHRRSAQMLGTRHSPVSRFHTSHGSVSSTSSFGQRTGSYASSYGLSVASSATSYGDHLSPGALSSATDTDFGPMSPYASSKSGNPSPRSSVAVARTSQRANPEHDSTHARKMSADSAVRPPRKDGVSRMKGVLICECCPKKPKKFDSHEELRLHELEKQYICQYCPNRFKNKNEAERHQNSLHLRRHSWSCAALAGVHAAFHPSHHPSSLVQTAADLCGYCGEEFPNPPNWEARGEHLNHVHKFGECNQSKKFFRADHFRQHLKHSHAGTSGKWTNMLENACMKDEPPPQERIGSYSVSSAPGPGLSKPSVISESHEES